MGQKRRKKGEAEEEGRERREGGGGGGLERKHFCATINEGNNLCLPVLCHVPLHDKGAASQDFEG